jgi:hypothetical protein
MTAFNETSPARVAARNGALDGQLWIQARPEPTKPAHPRKTMIRVRVRGRTMTLTGREAQTLGLLIERGERGLTSGEASPLGWARRTSAYIHRLRRLGFRVTTTREPAGDASVARYRLAEPVEVLPPDDGQDVADAASDSRKGGSAD